MHNSELCTNQRTLHLEFAIWVSAKIYPILSRSEDSAAAAAANEMYALLLLVMMMVMVLLLLVVLLLLKNLGRARELL